MKQTVDLYDFIHAFESAKRTNNFTRAALEALYDYLIDYEESIGEEQELDVISICCDFSEYDSALKAAEEFGHEPDPDDSEDEAEDRALDWLNERTEVITFDGGVIIQNF